MKRFLIGILSCLLLSGCAGGELPEEETPPAPEKAALGPAPAGVTVELEHEVYAPSLTRYTYFLRNGTEESLEFGEEYTIQRQKDGAWQDLTQRENTGFVAIGYTLAPGGTMALTCTLDLYQETPEPGQYRLVKPVGGGAATAEFELGESPYTAERPYGLAPLEELPPHYSASSAAATDVVFTNGGVKNAQGTADFLEKVRLNTPCQLRTVQEYSESWPMVIDVIYENDHFLWRMASDGAVTEKRFAYVVTDGTDLYLSNGADWAGTVGYESDKAFLVPPGAGAALVETVKAMTDARLAGNTARYRIWSEDGTWDACLTETPTEFGVGWQKPGQGARGSLYDLQDWDGLETGITGLAWQEDGALLLTCETLDGSRRLVFDPEGEQLTALGR